jgi:predicted kinase
VLILVGGAPGRGKTTLARLLADELGLPLYSRDRLKEVLLDVLGASDRAASREIGRASHALLFAIVDVLMDASVDVIVESNFRRGLSEGDLRSLVAKAPTVLLHCRTSREETVRRYFERLARGKRHEGHYDEEAVADLVKDLDAGRYEPLDLDVPTLVVDTTKGYVPGLEEIERLISSLVR